MVYLTTRILEDGETGRHRPHHRLAQRLGTLGLNVQVRELLHREGGRVLRTISLRLGTSLRIYSDNILGATGSDKGPTVLILPHQLVDLGLQHGRAGQFSFRILGLEHIPVRDLDLDQSIGEVNVQRIPLYATVRFVGENHLDEQRVRDGIADSLVDQVVQIQQVGESGQLRRDFWLVLAHQLLRLWGEQHRSMAIRLKVNTNIIVFCGVMKVFDSSWNTFHWQTLAQSQYESSTRDKVLTSDRYFVEAPLA